MDKNLSQEEIGDLMWEFHRVGLDQKKTEENFKDFCEWLKNENQEIVYDIAYRFDALKKEYDNNYIHKNEFDKRHKELFDEYYKQHDKKMRIKILKYFIPFIVGGAAILFCLVFTGVLDLKKDLIGVHYVRRDAILESIEECHHELLANILHVSVALNNQHHKKIMEDFNVDFIEFDDFDSSLNVPLVNIVVVGYVSRYGFIFHGEKISFRQPVKVVAQLTFNNEKQKKEWLGKINEKFFLSKEQKRH